MARPAGIIGVVGRTGIGPPLGLTPLSPFTRALGNQLTTVVPTPTVSARFRGGESQMALVVTRLITHGAVIVTHPADATGGYGLVVQLHSPFHIRDGVGTFAAVLAVGGHLNVKQCHV